MNSSGIKRGLAASAVAALAVAGIPAFASSASAAVTTSDTLTVHSAAGPIRNGNADGGSVVLKSNSGALVEADIRIANADYSNPQAIGAGNEISSPAADIDVISFDILDGNLDGDDDDTTGDLKFADGTYHYNLQTAVTLGTASSVTFGVVADAAPTGGVVNASDPKTNVTVTPTGAVASVDLSTGQPATVEGQPTTFNVEVKDAAGNLTQLLSNEEFDVTATGAPAPTISDTVVDEADLADGKHSFTVAAAVGSPDNMTVTITGSNPPAATITDSVSVAVYDNAGITTDEFDLVTGADNWIAGVTPFGAPNDRQVRVDQNEVTFSFQSKDGADLDTAPDDAGKVVGILVSSATIKVGGKDVSTQPAIVPVMLDAAGKGTGTITLSGVTAGSSLVFQAPGSGITATTLTFNRPSATSVTTDQGVYVTKIGSPTAVTVSVKDQFGNAIGGPAEVSITRVPDAPRTANAGTTARVAVGADGTATFTLPDAGTTAGTEDLDVNLFDDQFDGSAATTVDAAEISYTADGLGNDFLVGGATSDPTLTVVTPVYDSAAGAGDSVDLNVTAGTPGAAVKVTADNGALVLKGTETTVAQGSATDTVTLDNTGAAVGANDIRIVGTKTGVVTVTLESGGRTKTVKLTVAQPAAGPLRVATARNVEITAPEKATAGSVAVYTVKVTDAFGNPVSGVSVNSLNLQVSGPANVQSTDAVTDGNGELKVNVILTDNANSSVGVRVTGVVDDNAPSVTQFGDAANIVDGVAAPGIAASVNTATATVADVVNIAELQEAVDEAQEKVDNRQDALDLAQGNLSVAKAEKQVAQSEVKQAKKDLKKAKKKKKGVTAAKKALRMAKGELKIATAKVNSAKAAVATAKERLADAQEELAQAQADLEAAQD